MRRYIFITLVIVFIVATGCKGRFKVDFDSTPQGAEVYLDGTSIGKTPVPGADVTVGEHMLEFRLAGYHSIRRKILIERNASFKEIMFKLDKSMKSEPKSTNANQTQVSESSLPDDNPDLSLDEVFIKLAKKKNIIIKKLVRESDYRYFLKAVSGNESISNISSLIQLMDDSPYFTDCEFRKASKKTTEKGNVWEFDLYFTSRLKCIKICEPPAAEDNWTEDPDL